MHQPHTSTHKTHIEVSDTIAETHTRTHTHAQLPLLNIPYSAIGWKIESISTSKVRCVLIWREHVTPLRYPIRLSVLHGWYHCRFSYILKWTAYTWCWTHTLLTYGVFHSSLADWGHPCWSIHLLGLYYVLAPQTVITNLSTKPSRPV